MLKHLPAKQGLLGMLVLSFLAAGPSPAYAAEKEFFGTGLGAALGGLLGSQFGRGEGRLATTAAGVFVGGLVGQDVGQSLDRADRLSYRGYGHGYGYGAPTYYQPRTVYYEPTYVAPPPPPQRVIYVQQRQPVVHYYHDNDDYNDATYSSSGNYCREYTQRVRIGDRLEESYGTACLQPDGSWQVQR